jgi:non-specific serine/threonine protein kinase
MAGSDSPGISSVRLHTGQLPSEVTGFIGRGAELKRVAGLLTSARLITVTGPGGVGKTRLALRAATRAARELTAGACFADLSGLRDTELLPDTVATCLGLPPQDSRSQLSAVLAYLAPRRLILILDTCEHIVDACAIFAEAMIREAPGVTVLATSRQPLDVVGEHTFVLAPLPVPDGRAAPQPSPRGLGTRETKTPAAAESGDAIDLFAQRAEAVVPGFVLTDANWADAVRLCRRLDGMPLAIELAAVRLRALPLGELADRVEQRFEVITSGRRGGVPRHQTLRTAIGWSYDLCTEAERELWARLSVFAGTFDVAAVEDVCAETAQTPGNRGDWGNQTLTGGGIVSTFTSLVEKSVVQRDGSRYRLLDTLREFGAERLAASGRERSLRDRHLHWYLRMACYFGDHFLDSDQFVHYRRLRAEHDNLRAAMQYALTSGDEGRVRTGNELATALYGYWHMSGLMREGRHWLSLALGSLPPGSSPDRAWALIVRGYIATFGADVPQSVIDTEQGLEMVRELGDEGLLTARAWLYRNMALTFANRHEEALDAGREAERRLTALDDRIGLLCLDAQLGHLHELAGRPAESVQACERGLRRLGESDERWIQSYYHLVAGCALFFMGDRESDCVASVSRALRVKDELGDIAGCGYALEILAWVAAGNGRAERAAWLLGGADPLWRDAGGRLGANPIMEDYHLRAEKRARDDLGPARFAELFAQAAGSGRPPVVQAALANADDLAPVTDGRPEASGTLTKREWEIAELVGAGLSNREIASRLVIAKRTVDAHVEHIFAKLGISSRVQLAVRLRDRELPAPRPGTDR